MSVNKAIIIGNLGKAPEVTVTASGATVCTLSVATNEKWKDKNGDQQERTEWHRIVLWNKLAEIAEKYLHKGSQVYCEGKIQTRKWQDNAGNERYTTEIVAGHMTMLGGKGGQAGDHTPPPSAYDNAPYDAASGTNEDVPF